MEKILRRKFVLISVGAVFVVVFGMALVLNALNAVGLDKNASAVMDILAQHGGVFPEKPTIPYLNMDLPRELEYTTRYFTLNVDKEQNIVGVDIRHINSVDLTQAREYTRYVLESGELEGYYDNFKYRIVENENGFIIIFLDCEGEMITLRTFMAMSLQMAIVTLLSFSVIMVFVSKFAVAPIVQSYNKQQRFITDVSHELKTPLAIIKTNTEVIEMMEKSEWTDSIHNQIDRLCQLVNYLISLSKMEEQSHDELVKNNFVISDVLEEVIDTFSVVAQGENKEFICEISPNVNLLGDEQSIRMLISILIDNAIKYSIENTKISVSLTEKRSKKVLKVINYAENLKTENYNRLFERFFRLDDSRNSKTGGFGIGLATAKAIVKRHSGDIKAESVDGKQIIFTVEL